MLFMGIDTGSQGVRAVAADEDGRILASCSAAYPRINISSEPGYFEQSPGDWYGTVTDTVRGCAAQLRQRGIDPGDIAAVSIDGTSGTRLPVGSDKRPLMNAVMYNDPRSAVQAEFIHVKASALEVGCGDRSNASFALPKILWIKENAPDIFDRTRFFCIRLTT